MANKILISLGVLGVFAPTIGKAQQSKQPNIIFILADDLGYGDVSCFNENKLVMTPNLDKIAEQGVMMKQAYAYPVSAPTRSAFLTGSHAHEVGVYGNHDGSVPGVGVKRPTFTPKMQEAGYNTAWFGKWHQGWDVSNHPMNNGFDVAYGFLGGMHDFYDYKEGSHYNGGPYSQYAHVFDGFRPVESMGYFTQEITDRALDFIEKNENDPFYIYLAYNAPHTPVQAPDAVILKYLEMGYDAIASTRYAMIDVMDEQIGRILSLLENQGIDDNTMVLFMSDNGPEDEENSGGFRGTKFTFWEGGIRVPLLAKLPGVIPSGTESESICGIYDMASTFLSLATNNQEEQYGTGVNLMPYLQGVRKGNAHDDIVIALNPINGDLPYTNESVKNLAVRSKDWKLVKDTAREEWALYNLKNDPSERVNLIEKHPSIVKRLLKIADKSLSKSPMNSAREYSKNRSDAIGRAHLESYAK